MQQGRLVAIVIGLLFGTLLLVLPAAKLPLVGAGFVLLLIVMRSPIWGLILFALFATSLPYTSLNLGLRMTISEALLALTWVGVAWQSLIGQSSHPVQWHATERRLAWLMLFSCFPFLVGMVLIHADGNGPVNWIRWLTNLSALFLVPILLRTERDQERLILALLLGNLFMLVLSILIFLKDRNALSMMPVLLSLKYAHPEALQDIFSANYQRMGSPWVHPNLTGGALVLFIPLALFYGWTRPGWKRLLGFSVAILGCAGLLFSISRGAILSLALVLLWMNYKRVPYSGRIIGLGIVIALALVLFYPPLQDRLATMFSSQNASTEIRIDEYRRFPEALKTYPLGIGFKVDPPVPDSGLLGISNLWLNYIYKLGIPGMILFIMVTLSWWREVRPKSLSITRISRQNSIWLGTTAGILAALLTGIFDHYYSFTFVLIGLFWLLMGVSLQQIREKGESINTENSPKRGNRS